MPNQKISEMTYKQLAADDQIPSINSASPTTNFYALGGDIPLLVGISKWQSDAIYTDGQIVIYNGATTKGLFMANTTTSMGDAPDGTGFDKFKSISNSFISTNVFTSTDTNPSSLTWTTSKQRTGRCTFASGISCNGSTSVPQLVTCNINTGFTDDFLNTCKIDVNISGGGQSPLISVRNVVVLNSTFGTIQVTAEVYGTGSIYLTGRYLQFEINN